MCPSSRSSPIWGRDWLALTRVSSAELELLKVGGGALVEDNQVHREPFHPPIFHRLERLARHVELIDIGDADQEDRQIAGYAQVPQTRLPTAPAFDGFRRWAQQGRGVNKVSGQMLVLPGLTSIDAEVVQLHLSLRPGERSGALEGADVVMLVEQIQGLLA